MLRRVPGARLLLGRVNRALRWRIDEVLEPVRAELGRVAGQADWTANEMARLQPHVAALDARLEDLRVAFDDLSLSADDGETEQARGVLDEVRAEHAVIRERLSAIALYEERLRRLEESAAN